MQPTKLFAVQGFASQQSGSCPHAWSWPAQAPWNAQVTQSFVASWSMSWQTPVPSQLLPPLELLLLVVTVPLLLELELVTVVTVPLLLLVVVMVVAPPPVPPPAPPAPPPEPPHATSAAVETRNVHSA